MYLEVDKWYYSDWFGGIFKLVSQPKYLPNTDIYDVFYKEYNGSLGFISITPDALDELDVREATNDDFMVENL